MCHTGMSSRLAAVSLRSTCRIMHMCGAAVKRLVAGAGGTCCVQRLSRRFGRGVPVLLCLGLGAAMWQREEGCAQTRQSLSWRHKPFLHASSLLLFFAGKASHFLDLAADRARLGSPPLEQPATEVILSPPHNGRLSYRAKTSVLPTSATC